MKMKTIIVKHLNPNEETSAYDADDELYQMSPLTDDQGTHQDKSVQGNDLLLQTTEDICNCEQPVECRLTSCVCTNNITTAVPARRSDLEHYQRFVAYYRDQLHAHRDRMSSIMLSIVVACLIYVLVLVTVFLLWDYYKQI